MKIRFWTILLMTTFASVLFDIAKSSEVSEDGQVASTSKSANYFNSDYYDPISLTYHRRFRRSSSAVAGEEYAERINIALPQDIELSDAYRQRYRAKNRARMQPPERIDPAIRRRRRRRHRQRIQRYLRKLREELANDGAFKPSHNEEINEEICATERRVVQMESAGYLYYPSFYEEVYCKSLKSADGAKVKPTAQKYFDGILRCVQTTKDLYFTRVRRGESKGDIHILRKVPVGCQAMWPADQWGHREL